MKQVVFLVDMNAFYISCETTRNPALSGVPAAVAGDPKKRTGIILTANYEARRFGVKTTMTVHEALRICPGLILVPPDRRFYEEKSNEVMLLLSSFTPVIEQNSIDEAWLDMTGAEALFGKPYDAAVQIMDRIKNELGLWCSIGISENKFLSKMASEMKKPMGITELWKEDVPTKLWPLPVNSMYGIGKQTARKLQELGVETIGDLARYDRNKLIKQFGKMAVEMHLHANGEDISPVSPHFDNELKSIGRSVTLSEDISDIEAAKAVIMRLADEVGMSARKHNKKGRTVQITIKYSDFKVITRQATVPATFLTKNIFDAGNALLKRHWDPSRSVRLLGISLSGFSDEFEERQISIFEISGAQPAAGTQNKNKEEKLERTLDSIRQKHGISKVRRGLFDNASE